METIKDLWASVIAYVHERTTNPLTSAFAISWSLWNYKFFVLLFSDLSPAKTFAEIDALYPRPKTYYENGLLYPALTTVFYVFIYPYITSWVVTFYRRRQVEIANVIKKEEANRVRTPKEYNDMVRRYEKQLSAANSEIKESGQKAADLQAALDTVEQELASVRAPRADSHEEQSDAGQEYAKAFDEATKPETFDSSTPTQHNGDVATAPPTTEELISASPDSEIGKAHKEPFTRQQLELLTTLTTEDSFVLNHLKAKSDLTPFWVDQVLSELKARGLAVIDGAFVTITPAGRLILRTLIKEGKWSIPETKSPRPTDKRI